MHTISTTLSGISFALQLDRVRTFLSFQTPPQLHSLPSVPLPIHAQQAPSVVTEGEERSAHSAPPRRNKRDQRESIEKRRQRKDYNRIYYRQMQEDRWRES